MQLSVLSQVWSAPEAPALDVAFSPHGDYLLAGYVDGTARMWSRATRILSVEETADPKVQGWLVHPIYVE